MTFDELLQEAEASAAQLCSENAELCEDDAVRESLICGLLDHAELLDDVARYLGESVITYRFVTMTIGGLYGAEYDVRSLDTQPWWTVSDVAQRRAESDGYEVHEVTEHGKQLVLVVD